MSKDRTRDPQRDKKLSLQRDCRNSYGESPHAARKAIPKRKRMAHKVTRSRTRQDMAAYGSSSEEVQDLLESTAVNDTHTVGSWRKQPDSPLGLMVENGLILRQRNDGKIDREEAWDQMDRAGEKWGYL